jgi:hypothetical protein
MEIGSFLFAGFLYIPNEMRLHFDLNFLPASMRCSIEGVSASK